MHELFCLYGVICFSLEFFLWMFFGFLVLVDLEFWIYFIKIYCFATKSKLVLPFANFSVDNITRPFLTKKKKEGKEHNANQVVLNSSEKKGEIISVKNQEQLVFVITRARTTCREGAVEGGRGVVETRAKGMAEGDSWLEGADYRSQIGPRCTRCRAEGHGTAGRAARQRGKGAGTMRFEFYFSFWVS